MDQDVTDPDPFLSPNQFHKFMDCGASCWISSGLTSNLGHVLIIVALSSLEVLCLVHNFGIAWWSSEFKHYPKLVSLMTG